MFARKKHLFSRRTPALFVDGLRLIGYVARNAMFAFLQEQLNIMREWIKHLQHPLVLAGIAFLLAAAFWFFLSKGRKSSKSASGRLDATQVIYLLSLLALLVLAVLTWNDRTISMPLLGSLLGSVVSGLPILRAKPNASVSQEVDGENSTALSVGGNVVISDGGKSANMNNTADGQQVPPQVSQQVGGKGSTAVSIGGSVEIRRG